MKAPPADLAEAHRGRSLSLPPVTFFSSLVPVCSELQAALQGLTHAPSSVFLGTAFLATHGGHTMRMKEFSLLSEKGTAGFKENCHKPVLTG